MQFSDIVSKFRFLYMKKNRATFDSEKAGISYSRLEDIANENAGVNNVEKIKEGKQYVCKEDGELGKFSPTA